MRKIDLLLLFFVIAVGAAFLRPGGAPPPPVSVSVTPSTTASGKWEVLPCRYELANLKLGMTGAQVEATRGIAAEKRQENAETSIWTYRGDGAELHLTLLDGRLISVNGSGRWSLTEEGQSRPGFLATEAQVRAAFGEPQRREHQSQWVYNPRPSELQLQFNEGRVTNMYITTEIKSRPL